MIPHPIQIGAMQAVPAAEIALFGQGEHQMSEVGITNPRLGEPGVGRFKEGLSGDEQPLLDSGGSYYSTCVFDFR